MRTSAFAGANSVSCNRLNAAVAQLRRIGPEEPPGAVNRLG